MRLRTHRWWLAAVAALFTPWIGPHISEYLPIGFLLILGVTTGLGSDRPDGAFWMIACGLVVVSYGSVVRGIHPHRSDTCDCTGECLTLASGVADLLRNPRAEFDRHLKDFGVRPPWSRLNRFRLQQRFE